MTEEELATVVETIAPVVREYVSKAMGDLGSRLVAAETRLSVLGDLRDRVVMVEAKSAQPIVVPPQDPTPQVDFSPFLERVAAAEARLSILGDLRDRVVTVETKAAQPVVHQTVEPSIPVDLTPILERMASAEARLEMLGDLRDRVVVVETKTEQPLPSVDLSEIHNQLSTVDVQLKFKSAEVQALVTTVSDHAKEIGGLRERLAVSEARLPVVGPKGDPGDSGAPGRDGLDGKDGLAGKDGVNGKDAMNGKDGLNGKDGADGLGWDDLAVTQNDERTFTVKCTRGLQVKELGTLTFPVEIYRGVYLEGKSYDRGDGVTWGGSEWHANETTTSKPGDGSKAWTLKVKRGRDGKDGRDAMDSVPVVSIGKR